MALGSCGHRITHQLRPINMNGRSILSVTSIMMNRHRIVSDTELSRLDAREAIMMNRHRIVSDTELSPQATLDPASPNRPPGKGISQTPSAKSQTTRPVGLVTISDLAARFPLPWSHYVRLLAVKQDDARRFYEQEALRGGWSIRQLGGWLGSSWRQPASPPRQPRIWRRRPSGVDPSHP